MKRSEILNQRLKDLTTFEDQLVKRNGRCEVSLLSKDGGDHILDDNRDIAIARLQSLVRRISKKGGFLERYDRAIRQYTDFGHTELVPPKVIDLRTRPIYYMSHREVFREGSVTTNMKVVFDASSHAKQSKFLNECLETVRI